MQIIDLSHLLTNQTPVYPGTEKPVFEQANTIEKDGFAETKISMYSHTGTHMDAPAHMLPDTKSLDVFEPSKFYGNAICIDCTAILDTKISKDFLIPFLEKSVQFDFVLLKTGWSKKWGKKEYFEGFPTLSLSACEYLTGFNLKGIGIDVISIDKMDTVTYENHLQLLKNEVLIIENLINLDALNNEVFKFSCFPLKFENADGSPVRAIAIMDD